MLHDPHADVRATGLAECRSAKKIVAAARAIMDLVYKICATTFDLIYLEHGSSFCWFMAGATLIRFLSGLLDAGEKTEASKIKQELAVIRFALWNL